MIEAEKLPALDRIFDVSIKEFDDSKRCVVNIRYIDRKQLLTEIDIPLSDAILLLNLLGGVSKELGLDQIRHLADKSNFYDQTHFNGNFDKQQSRSENAYLES